MPLPSGTRLGPYEIQSAIGAGGMGEVYRAHDVNLDRYVAIKILPAAFAHDPDRLARFGREAKTLASLNHPNIAIVHGFEEANGINALVMELIDGATLASRIARGPIQLDEALPIARQIADALEAAHEHGVIHRDLKPSNIKVRSDGTVKVLDFGLAKVLDAQADLDASQSPIVTSPAVTHKGVILGTAAYMSPEQARGKPVDRRADIWAFGCVVFEMLTGRPTFSGGTVSDVIAAILKTEPDWNALPPDTPEYLGMFLRRALQKDPRRRLPHIGVLRLEIEEGPAAPAIAAGEADRNIPARRSGRRRLMRGAAAGALVLGFGAAVVWLTPTRTGSPAAALRLNAELGPDLSLVITGAPAALLSPDGTTLAFVGRKSGEGREQIYIRRLDQLAATPLAGTDGARDPFFSPDGQWIAFFADRKLKKGSPTGGSVITICDAPVDRGGAWAKDGTIVFQRATGGSGLSRVSSAGGNPEPFTTLGAGEFTHRFPQVLPDDRAVLYTSNSNNSDFENANLAVLPLSGGTPKVVHRGGYYGRYLASGHLVYIHEGTLFAAPFDLQALEVTGKPAPVLEHVSVRGVPGAAQVAVSDRGTLVYLPEDPANDVPIEWMDRSGNTTPLRTARANWGHPRFSPDGSRLAMAIADRSGTDLWAYDWRRDVLTRLTFDPAGESFPVWTPDGRRIAFASNRDNSPGNLYWQRTDGTGGVQQLSHSRSNQRPYSWHPSGRFLAFSEQHDQTDHDIMILPIEGEEASGWKPGTPTVFVKSPAADRVAMFSPDGRWLAYDSEESGRREVYVQPFPGPGGRWQISKDGGAAPTWARSRRELLFAASGQILAVPYTVDGDSFRAESPRLWSPGRFATRTLSGTQWDLHPDGERIALATVVESEPGTGIDKVVFIFNFFDELGRIAPRN